MSTNTRFEEEAKGNSEMAYYIIDSRYHLKEVNNHLLYDQPVNVWLN